MRPLIGPAEEEKAAARRHDAATVLGTIGRLTGRLRRTLLTTMRRELPVVRSRPKDSWIWLERQLRNKNFKQLAILRRREKEKIKAERRRISEYTGMGRGLDLGETLRHLEARCRFIDIELRRRGYIMGD